MPEAQDVLFALHVDADGGRDAIAGKEFAVDHQDQQILGHGSWHELLQFARGGRFPMATDAGAFNAIAFEALVHGSGIIAGRALAGQLTGHPLLERAVVLKGLITLQADFLIVATQTRPFHRHLASAVNDVAVLATVSMHGLLPPGAHLGLNLHFHDPLHDRQPQLGGKGFYILAGLGQILVHRQLRHQKPMSFVICFSCRLFFLSFVSFHLWFSWLIVNFYQLLILSDGSRRTTSNFNCPRDIPIHWRIGRRERRSRAAASVELRQVLVSYSEGIPPCESQLPPSGVAAKLQ
jgi:hypothetical protein